MSILDKIVAAVTPLESDEDRRDARLKARGLATQGGWLDMVLDHHEMIEHGFAAVRSAAPADRPAAQKRLGVILTGHSIAEESVLYPALVDAGDQGSATMAYTEQAAAKTQMALLEKLDPASQEYMDKLEHIRGAVLHHMYEEEGTWFAELGEKASQIDQAKLAQRYTEEFERYTHGEFDTTDNVASAGGTAGSTVSGYDINAATRTY